MPELDNSSKTLVFFVNGKKIEDDNIDPEWTLLRYLRDKLNLAGTKLGCAEGGCGACTVMVSRIEHQTSTIIHRSTNACLALVASMHGGAVTTVEGIGSIKSGLHAVQERIARAHGSQCGFCTPGIVMSMYTLLRNTPHPTMEQIEENFTGNLCRCTGYRPILEGVRTFSKEAGNVGCGKKNCCQLSTKTEGINGELNGNDTNGKINGNITEVLFDPNEFNLYDPSQEIIFPPELKVDSVLDYQTLEFNGERVTFFRPTTLTHILQLKAKHPNAKLVVGNTEVGVEVKFKNQVYPVIINPSFIPELSAITKTQHGVEFGAAVTLSSIEETLKEEIKEKKRLFYQNFYSCFGNVQMVCWKTNS